MMVGDDSVMIDYQIDEWVILLDWIAHSKKIVTRNHIVPFPVLRVFFIIIIKLLDVYTTMKSVRIKTLICL